MLRSISYKFRRKRYGYRKHKYNNFISSKAKTIALLISIVLSVIIIMLFPHFIRNTYEIVVTNKQIIKHNNTDEYIIYAQTEKGDIKVFLITNNLLELKFNSEDLYWAMQINRKYEVRAYGFNMPMFSDYQNIVNVKGLESSIPVLK